MVPMSIQASLAWGPSLQFRRTVAPPELQGKDSSYSGISRLAEEGNPSVAVLDVYRDLAEEEDEEDN